MNWYWNSWWCETLHVIYEHKLLASQLSLYDSCISVSNSFYWNSQNWQPKDNSILANRIKKNVNYMLIYSKYLILLLAQHIAFHWVPMFWSFKNLTGSCSENIQQSWVTELLVKMTVDLYKILSDFKGSRLDKLRVSKSRRTNMIH